MIRKIFTLLFLFSASACSAQIGGTHTYEFLQLPFSARVASMGGDIISIRDHDLNLSFENPALLNPAMDKQIVLNYSPFLAGIKYGSAAFCRSYEKAGTFSAAIDFADYGTMDQTDIYGETNGTFSAADYALKLGYARPIDSIFFIGLSLNTIYSHYEEYSSFGMAVDAGINYTSRNKLLGIGLVAKNIGTQLKTYRTDNTESLPVEIQLGVSRQLSKAPFRFNLTFTHLEKWDLTYVNPQQQNEIDPITGDPKQPDEPSFFDKTMRHVTASVEILITENFNLRLGYNYRRRQEMSIESTKSLAGFSGGFGLKISRFILSYGFAKYHLAGAASYFSIATNIQEFTKKK